MANIKPNNDISPIANIDWSFGTYLNQRVSKNARHITGDDVPDYAFGQDYEFRKKLDSIPGLHSLATKYSILTNSQFTQLLNRSGMAVGPTQFPEVYDIACDCARRLGIAVPSVFIVNDPSLNAGTMCADDAQPSIMLNSGLYERVTLGELKTIIGHECGHIQNNHYVYTCLFEQIVSNKENNPMYSLQDYYITLGARALLQSWSRAAEVTCDRAGMICADNINDAYTAEAKMLYGATLNKNPEIDFDELEKQLKIQMSNMSKLEEWYQTHPGTLRRIMAEKEFAECEVLYSWRPDLKNPDMTLRSKAECDERCKSYINLTSSKGAK